MHHHELIHRTRKAYPMSASRPRMIDRVNWSSGATRENYSNPQARGIAEAVSRRFAVAADSPIAVVMHASAPRSKPRRAGCCFLKSLLGPTGGSLVERSYCGGSSALRAGRRSLMARTGDARAITSSAKRRELSTQLLTQLFSGNGRTASRGATFSAPIKTGERLQPC